ncbi:MAG: type VI secretion system tip protein TssI/VgrG [Polyangiaceae bacterium]
MKHSRQLTTRLESSAFSTDHLEIQRVRGTEQISRLFGFDIELRTPEQGLPEGCVPGASVSLVLEDAGDGERTRFVHGIIDAIDDRMRASHGRRAYLLRLVPRAARLELTETQEVFVDESVPSIVRGKLALHGLGPDDFELRLRGSYPARESVVEYMESDLAFVARLTEHLGISYFFEHDRERTRLVFTDDEGGFTTAIPLTFDERGDNHHLHALGSRSRRVPSSVFVQDHNYRVPLVELTGAHDLERGHGGGIVHYGTHHKTPEEGQLIARIRAQELESRRFVYAGESGAIALSPGHRVAIFGHPDLSDGAEILVTKVEHDAEWSSEEGTRGASYRNAFEAVPVGFTYRPPRSTPRPRIHGFVTGVVKSHENARDGSLPFLDEHGRYLVELQFDTLRAPHKQRASHRIRMAQPFAGPNHGMHFPLRPGAEVLVGFLDGDPDRPVILGAVPNAIAPSPVTHHNPNAHVVQLSSGIRLTIRD